MSWVCPSRMRTSPLGKTSASACAAPRMNALAPPAIISVGMILPTLSSVMPPRDERLTAGPCTIHTIGRLIARPTSPPLRSRALG